MLSRRGSLILALGFGSCAVGILSNTVALIILGLLLLGAVFLIWISYLSAEKALLSGHVTALRYLESKGRGGRTIPGVQMDATVTVVNRADADIPNVRVHDHVPEAFEIEGDTVNNIDLRGKSKYEYTYTVTPLTDGKHVFGSISLFISSPLDLFFNECLLPGSEDGAPHHVEVNPSLDKLSHQIDLYKAREMGAGTDFAGIDRYVRGDPFRLIEWKATARTGDPMIVKTDEPKVTPTTIFLDISPSMNVGLGGRTKLDYASGIATLIANFLLECDEPVGLYTFSDKVHERVKPNFGRRHIYNIIRVISNIDTEEAAIGYMSYNDVIKIIMKYLDLSHREKSDGSSQAHKSIPYILQRIINPRPRHEDVLRLIGEYLGLSEEGIEDMITDFRNRVIRWYQPQAMEHLVQYSEERGLRLPFLPMQMNTDVGLTQALREVINMMRRPGIFVIISDLWGFENSRKMFDALRLARGARHKVIILSPYTPWFERGALTEEEIRPTWNIMNRVLPEPPEMRAGKSILSITEELYFLNSVDSRRSLEDKLTGFGIPLLTLGPDDHGLIAMAQINRLRMARA